MPTAHLLFGFLGSGKTILARDLEQRHRAVRFTPDEWMARLFGEDPPADTFPQSAAAILGLMEPIWTRCLHLGIDVVLDYGFWRRAERDQARWIVEACEARASSTGSNARRRKRDSGWRHATGGPIAACSSLQRRSMC